MKQVEVNPGEAEGRVLGHRETAEALQERFAWKPGRFASLLVKALSLVLDPLETGTYRGRALAGEPHRSYRVLNTPLTVFVIPEGRLRRYSLVARLRARGSINIIQDPAVDPRQAACGDHTWAWGSFSMESLVAIQRSSGDSIVLAPVTSAYHQHHPEAPATTFLTRLYMLTPMHLVRRAASFARTAHTAGLMTCKPMDLAEWLAGNPGTGGSSQATTLHNAVISRFESECRACTGPPLPQPWQFRKAVLRDPILIEFMKEHAAGEGRRQRKVAREARAHIREIASKVRVGVLRYFGFFINMGFDRLLKGFHVDREGIRLISESDIRSRLVLVCCHRSYMDPIVLTYGICRSGLMAPQQAAGINLDIWPLGWVLRRCGAFYMRRSFADQPVYREVFNACTRRLLADNYVVAFYIEGTRSRDGKMRKPKTGFLRILDEALSFGTCEGITVLPVYLGYDRVPEEGAHVREMAGGSKITETLGLFKRLYVAITDTLGNVYMRFGEPMDLHGIVSRNGLSAAADLICEKIDEITVVTARSLASFALLSSGRPTVTADEYERNVEEMLRVCRGLGAPLAPDADTGGTRAAVDWLAAEGRVAVEKDADGALYFRVEGDMRRFLEYNKNILLSHLLGPSLAALAEISDRRTEEALPFLQRLFTEEFVIGPGFAEKAGVPAASSGLELLASILDSFLEGYLVACTALVSVATGEQVGKDKLVALCFTEGARMLEAGSIKRLESLSRIIFENAIKSFVSMGLLSESSRDAGRGKEETVLARGDLYGERENLEERIWSFLDRDGSGAA